MRSHRRRHPVPHVLIAGDAGDLDAIGRLLGELPADAYGQVIVEADVLPVLATPARVTVSCLTPAARPDGQQPLVLAARGTLLLEAVRGWVAEWMPEELDDDRSVALWVGGRANPRVDALCEGLPVARL
jgi:hypothetical protein